MGLDGDEDDRWQVLVLEGKRVYSKALARLQTHMSRLTEKTVVFEQLADGFGWTNWREARDSLGSVLGEAGRTAAEVPRAPGGGAGASVDEARKRKTEEKRAEKERKKKAKAEKKREREDTEEEEPPKKQREGGEISES